MTQFFLVVFAILLALMNAVFVAAEFGMVKLRNTRVQAIKEQYGIRGRILAQIHQHLDAYLSACQLGITLASLGLGWIGEPAFAYLLEPIFAFGEIINPEMVRIISFVVAFSLISFLHIVVGELMPKSMAIRQSEKVSLWTAVPIYIFYWIMYPAIWLLNTCSNKLLKLTHLDVTHHGEHFYSTEEIKLILSASHLHGELTKEEIEILEHTLDFADLRVTEIMRPRKEMIVLRLHDPISVSLDKIVEHRFSRYPVCEKNHNKILGIIHVKDLFANFYQHKQIKNLKSCMRPIIKVSDRLLAIDLLRKFREGMSHFALVYDQRHILIGFVTLDNLLHILIGKIKDEFHKTQDDWVKNPDGSILVRGDCSIYALETALGYDIELQGEEAEVNTLNGLILVHLGSLPKEGDKIQFKEFDVIIEKMQETRILYAKIIPKLASENRERL